jgi:hypothetical protein
MNKRKVFSFGVCFLLSLTVVSTEASVPGGFQGYLYEPDGVTPVNGGWIDIKDLSEQPWMGTAHEPGGSIVPGAGVVIYNEGYA